MDNGAFDPLKLENQLCFPLYACAREIVKLYKPFLDEIGLTYTQYITMLVLWEEGQTPPRTIGARLHLDPGTLTPVLKKLAEKGLLERSRSSEDERNLTVTLTDAGAALKRQAADIPARVGACVRLDPQEASELYGILHKLLGQFKA